MQLTSILSDLTSLRACDHSAAIALVTARAPVDYNSPEANSIPTLQSLSENDPDLRRPHEIQTLHETIKLSYGSDPHAAPKPAIQELQQARVDVRRAVAALGLRTDDHQYHQPAKSIPESPSSQTISNDMQAQITEEDRLDAEYGDDELAAWS